MPGRHIFGAGNDKRDGEVGGEKPVTDDEENDRQHEYIEENRSYYLGVGLVRFPHFLFEILVDRIHSTSFPPPLKIFCQRWNAGSGF